MAIVWSLVAGLVFGLGILVSGMGNPAKVANFFDVAGSWDPSLAFVMGGAVVVTFIGYRVVLGWPGPTAGDRFHLPTATAIDVPLVLGAAVFGVGWGIAGFCPGGLVPVLGLGRAEPFVFLAGLAAGIVGTRLLRKSLAGGRAVGSTK